MDPQSPKQPRSAEEIIESLRDMQKSLRDNYQLREPEFVLTRTEMVFVHQWAARMSEDLKKSRAYAEKVDGLLLERNAELMKERLQREAYQVAAETSLETIEQLTAVVRDLQRENQ